MIPFFHHPGFDHSRELNHQLWQGVEAWLHLQQTGFDYQLMILEVWLKTVEEFLQVLPASLKEAALQPEMPSWQKVVPIWSQLFDHTFAETFRSAPALQVRSRYLTASALFKEHQQRIIDVFLKGNDLPTRSELDEIHRSIYELRKEIKSLKQTFTEPHGESESG